MYFGRKRKYAAKLRAQERKKPSRIISLLLVISMLCGNFVGMPTGAAEMVAYCGMEEHTHSEACYCAVQAEGEAAAETLAAAVPTEETAAETTEETTAPTEGTALSVSGGSDAQALIGEYVEKELCCGMEEHKHDIACYANPLADLETAAIWEATLPENLSGDWGKDLAEVAKSQLGYAESTANYLVGADGETLMGYSRYGAWYSSYTQDEKQAYADWNVPFLFFCLYYAGVEDFPIEEDCADWTAALAAAELWREAAGEYIPEAGDLVFLDTDDDGAADRAAVVTDWDEAKVTAVEGDSEGAVKTVTYDLTEDTQVLGYGDTNEAQAQGEYIPEAGDLVFLDTDDDGAADRAAVVTDWDEAKVTAVESDSEGAVKTVTYDLTEDTQVLGYGNTNEAQAQVEVSGGEDAPQLMSNTTFTIYFAGWQDWSGYAVHAYVLRGGGSNWQDVEMTQLSDTYTKDGTTYNVYKADVTEVYGGFDVVRFYKGPVSDNTFYYTANSAWVEKEKIEGKIYVPDKGWYDDYSSSGSSGGNDDVTTTLPDVPSGNQRVFYDATLSKLSYNGDGGTATIPVANGNSEGSVIYCHYWEGAEGSIQMIRLNNYTSGANTWSDTYYADIPSAAKKVLFYSSGSTSTYPNNSSQTVDLDIPDNITNPCFYGNSSDDVIYNSNAKRSGYWGEAFMVRNPGTVVDIPKETRENTADTLYLNTTFYDYYTDFELNGNNRDYYSTDASKTTHRIYQPFRHFNQALSSYYSGINASNPLYWGNFQNYSGDHFDEIADTLNLYGYSDNKNKFFAENNSMWGYNGGELTNDNKDGAQATMGLVSNELTNGNLMIKTSGGSAIAPYFSKSFLEGGNSKNTVLGKVYENVSFPFTKKPLTSSSNPSASGTVDYWVFDSRDTTLRLKEDSTDGYWLDSTGVNAVYGSTATQNSTSDKNFFPFNDENQSAKSQRLNYGFATKLELKFRLTEDGTVKTTENKDVPIEFNFSGDDDVWVFIDGKLALDVGGGHGRVAGYLNFKDKKYHVDRVKGSSNGVEYNKEGSFEMSGANTDEHTLTMFYMERGLWESNMRITFNFPDENQLEVEKEVDIGNVNDIFKDSFKNQKLFTFNIKNLATHYAAKAVTGSTVSPISVDGTASHHYGSNTFEKGTYQGYSNTFHWYARSDDLDNGGSSKSTWRHRRYGVITLPSTVDISSMGKLSFYLYYNDSNGFSLNDLYLQLLSSNVPSGDLIGSSSTAGDSYALGSLGTSSLSGKTYGSVNTSGNTWVKVTLDLSKLSKGSSFNNTAVQYIRFGCDYSRNIYLRGFTFEPAAQESFEVGFVTKQYDIPDYGSIAAMGLVNPTGAVYTSNMFTGAHVIGSDGTFALEDGEIVNFHDQFRRGSYIYLEEVLTARENALYDTTWTMYENDKAVTYMADDGVVNVSSSSYDVVDVASNTVNDGRSEVYTTGTDSGQTLNNSGYTSTARPSAGGFVFRSYADPDSTATTTKLKVKFTNTVNTANLTISKVDKNKNTNSAIDADETFTFKILFYNVGGVGLESSTITHTVTLKAGDSTTISGIPVNTQYAIYELQNNDEIVLDSVSGAHDAFYATTYGGTDAYMVGGSLGTTDKSVTFTNVKKPTISLKVTKKWEDTDGNTPTDIPDTIYLRLLYRKTGTTTWESYVSASGFTGYQTVALTPGYGAWEYTFTPLDVYVNYPDDQTMWEYKVVELDPETNAEVTDSVTFDGMEYKVTYSTPTTVANGGTSTQTITNTQDSKTSLTLTKNWTFADGTTPLTDKNVLKPITVQLQRKAKNVDGATWAGAGDPVIITEASDTDTGTPYSWTYTFSDLDKTGTYENESVEWEYQVIELKVGDENVTDGSAGDFKVNYGDVTTKEDDGSFEQTITNAYNPKIDISVNKVWPGIDSNDLSAVMVRLERKLISGSWDNSNHVSTVVTAELTEKAGWSHTFVDLPVYNTSGVQFEYRIVELTGTGENQAVVANDGYIVHDGRLFKVTYSNPNLAGSNAPDTTNWTITNTVQTVNLDITKRSSVMVDGVYPTLDGATFKLEKQTETPDVYTQVGDEVTTSGGGKAQFSSLSCGVYRLTETQAAAGYSLLASPIKIEITANVDGTFTIKVDDGTGQTINLVDDAYTHTLTIYNKPKLDMPATGGVGGFEFWILGGLLIMAVPLLMYTFIWYRKGGKYLQR